MTNQKKSYKVIGLMSGTSLDGIDLCEVEFSQHMSKWTFKILKATTIPYTKEWVDQLQQAHHLSNTELQQLDDNYTELLSEVISDFMKTPETIDMVCSHGHTVLHQPENGLTYQIGNLPLLAQHINKTLVCDFRTADVALGGQGAPLVPIGDRLLFREYDYCINLGGFVNISFEKAGDRVAFDICPANKILNYFAKQLGLNYDDKGKIAKSGKCHPKLLEILNSLNYYSTPPPKSLGVEWLENEMLPVLEQFNLSEKDILNTLCQHIALQISKGIENKSSKVLITGGGAYHKYMMNCLKKYLPDVKLHIPSPEIIDYKEALIFALLGVLKYRGDINVLSSVTGAKHDHSSGMVFEVKP